MSVTTRTMYDASHREEGVAPTSSRGKTKRETNVANLVDAHA